MSRSPGGRRSSRETASAVAPEATSTASEVQLDIDPGITAGFIHDRYDIQVHGRIFARQPVEYVGVSLDGDVVGRVAYGTPDEASGNQYVFNINLPMRRSAMRRQCICLFTVRLTTGETYEARYELAVDPTGPVAVSIISGRIHSATEYGGMGAPVLLYVERAALDDDGRLQVFGWAISQRSLATVQVLVNDQRIDNVRVGGRRDDVGSAFPGYSNAPMSGFSLVARIAAPGEALPSVRIQAISGGGDIHEVVVLLERVRALNLPELGETAPAAPGIPPSPQLASEPAYGLVAGFQVGPGSAAATAPSLPATSAAAAQPAPAPMSAAPDPRREICFFCDDIDLNPNGHLRVVGWAVCATGVSAISIYLNGEHLADAELGLLREDVGDEDPAYPDGALFRIPLRPGAQQCAAG